MLASVLMIAALSINDAKMFFNGGDAMPNTVAGVPSDSLRGAAILPEIYGTISGWLERMLLPPYGLYDVEPGQYAKPVDPKASRFNQYLVISPSLCSNRVVSTRYTYLDLMHRIVDERMMYGYLSDGYDFDAFGYGSSKMPGDAFPTIAWTNKLFSARTPAEWSRVWQRLADCPVDGVWKTRTSDGPGGWLANTLEGLCIDGTVDQAIYRDFYENYYWAIYGRRSQTSCLDLLRAQIGDEAYALTNRTMRLDRRFMTALENALGLMDLAPLALGDSWVDAVSLTHGYTSYAGATVSATWQYNAGQNRISISYDTPSWATSNSWSTATNWTGEVDYVLFACGGSDESVVVSAALLDPIAVTVPLDLILDLVDYAPGAPDSTIALTEIQSSDGILTYRFNNGRSLGANLNNLAGTNRLTIAATAHQTATVAYSLGLSDWSPPAQTRWLLANGYVPSVDLACIGSCRHIDGVCAFDSDGFPYAPSATVREASSSQRTVEGTEVNIRGALEAHVGTLIDHADGHIARATGRNIRSRASVLPAAGSFTPAGSGYARVAAGGTPNINTPSELMIESSPSLGHVVVIISDDASSNTRTIDYNVAALDPEHYPDVTLATITYGAQASISNALPHVSAAYAEAYPWVEARGHFRWRNLRFDD